MRYSSKKLVPLLLILFAITAVNVYAGPLLNSPVLVIATDNKFGSYTCEILKAEGFNEFEMVPPNDAKITSAYLKRFDIIILTESRLSVAEKDMLAKYVDEGGNLIAFRPDKKLSQVFGISKVIGPVAEGYISINANEEIGKGITNELLQFHGEADQYELKSAKKIASLFKDASSDTQYPAVVLNEYGRGHAMAFLYNLPQSIVYTRQGNYRHAAQEMDGITGIRAMDLFTRGWVDTTKNTLNQADEQMRLLSHGIEKMNRYKKPLPRFWYFPDTLQCLVTLNNDGEDSKENEFIRQFEEVDSMGAKMTLYIKELDLVSRDRINEWVKRGFEIAGHPDDTKQAVNPDWRKMDSVYKNIIDQLDRKYGVAAMRTTTNHWFVWCGRDAAGAKDFAAQARIEERNGVRLDCNYAHYDNNSSQGHFLGAFGTNQGNYTGSGLIMKFADVQGKRIDLYQQLNNVYDQQYMEHKDQEGYYNCFKGLMDRSIKEEVYSYICVKAHNNEYFFSRQPLLRSLEYARSKGIPVWTELKLLGFLEARDEAGFTDIKWSGNQLSFKVNSSVKHDNRLTCMIPYFFNDKKISAIAVNGTTHPWSVKSIKGFDYALVMVMPGSGYEITISYFN